ncbi:hypothetical protein F5144DRAFT_621762 [Chaetomium tenue]|uniref:Uncharacterized protein n=1 Tax=Chaetomium tenue TaxID=1854479 RepID=A0ACB7P0V6_9PEZI|nr:hypothetical protein F5144DRAFT_621762 [Chaetomium globosum]
MSATPDFVGPSDQASLETSLNTSRSRKSIVASLRHKTSRLLGRNATNNATADNTPQPLQPEPSKSKRGWFHSVGSRFHRHDHIALGSSECSQEIQVVMEEAPQKTDSPSSPETTPPRSPMRRRRFRSRLRLHSLPARFRQRGVSLFSRSPSLSDEDKENFVVVAAPARSGEGSNTGSWSSFRSGVQRAVREVVDSNFRFSEERSHNHQHSGPLPRPSRPPPRVPLRTLWTIMSADSSESVSTRYPFSSYISLN